MDGLINFISHHPRLTLTFFSAVALAFVAALILT